MATIVGDIFADSLTDIGQLGEGQSPSPEQINRCLRYANRLLSKLSTKRYFIYAPRIRSYVLTPGLQDYTVGPSGGATFPDTRPVFVQAAQIRAPGSLEDLGLSLLDNVKWGAIRDKGATCSANGVPQDIFLEYTFPNFTFHIWTIPSNSATVKLATWDQLQQFLTAFDQFNMPPEYEIALQKILAVELCSAYDMPVPPSVQDSANDALISIQTINAQALSGALDVSQLLQAPNLSLPPTAGGGGQ